MGPSRRPLHRRVSECATARSVGARRLGEIRLRVGGRLMSATHAERAAGVRPGWRAVAMPSEHGGWGLTLEPVVLGLLVGWSGAGFALGIAAFTAFLLRTRPSWWRSISAWTLAGPIYEWRCGSRCVELVVLGCCVAAVVTSAGSGRGWVPVVVGRAARGDRVVVRHPQSRPAGWCPSCAVRSASPRSRRRSSTAAGRGHPARATGVWLVLGGSARVRGASRRRVQIRGCVVVAVRRWQSDLAQVIAVVVAAVAVAADGRLLLGLAGVVVVGRSRSHSGCARPPIPAKQLGLRQMAIGMALVSGPPPSGRCGELEPVRGPDRVEGVGARADP